MSYQTLPELFPEEKAMPLAKYYYDYPMQDLPQELKDKIFGPPMDIADAVPAEKFVEWLKPVGEYEKVENGYCMFPDGSGYICTYLEIPSNIHSKSMVHGHGNLRYKIWNPADHWDHYFVNWTDKSDGIHTTESLDLGEGDRKYDTIRHSFNLRPFGLTDEKIKELQDSGCTVSEMSDWESFDEPGAHLTLGQIRPKKGGGFERRSCEWIGWRPGANGELIREPRTHCDEAYLRKVAYHTLIEWQHMMSFINDLYDEYSELPLDAD